MHKQALELAVKYRGYVSLSDASGLYVSWCPLLDIKSQGTSAEEARASLNDSVRMFVVHCFRRGILEEVLKNLGLEETLDDAPEPEEHVSVRPIPAAKPLVESWEGEVPLYLVAAAQAQHALG
jgi:hypothetical protein